MIGFFKEHWKEGQVTHAKNQRHQYKQDNLPERILASCLISSPTNLQNINQSDKVDKEEVIKVSSNSVAENLQKLLDISLQMKADIDSHYTFGETIPDNPVDMAKYSCTEAAFLQTASGEAICEDVNQEGLTKDHMAHQIQSCETMSKDYAFGLLQKEDEGDNLPLNYKESATFDAPHMTKEEVILGNKTVLAENATLGTFIAQESQKEKLNLPGAVKLGHETSRTIATTDQNVTDQMISSLIDSSTSVIPITSTEGVDNFRYQSESTNDEKNTTNAKIGTEAFLFENAHELSKSHDDTKQSKDNILKPQLPKSSILDNNKLRVSLEPIIIKTEPVLEEPLQPISNSPSPEIKRVTNKLDTNNALGAVSKSENTNDNSIKPALQTLISDQASSNNGNLNSQTVPVLNTVIYPVEKTDILVRDAKSNSVTESIRSTAAESISQHNTIKDSLELLINDSHSPVMNSTKPCHGNVTKPLWPQTQIQDFSVKNNSQNNNGLGNGDSSHLTKNAEHSTFLKHDNKNDGFTVESNKERGQKPATDQKYRVPLVWGRPTEIGAPQKIDTINSEIKRKPINFNTLTSQNSNGAKEHESFEHTPFLREPRKWLSFKNAETYISKTHELTGKEETLTSFHDEAMKDRLDIIQKTEPSLMKDKKTETNGLEFGSSTAGIGLLTKSDKIDSPKEDEKIQSRILEGCEDRNTSVQNNGRREVNNEVGLATPGLFIRLRKLISNIKLTHGSKRAQEDRSKEVSQKLEDFGYWDEISDDGSQISGYSQGSGIYLKRIREMEADEGRRKGHLSEPRSQLEELIMLCQSGDLLTRDGR
jgi:hypothetical protein